MSSTTTPIPQSENGNYSSEGRIGSSHPRRFFRKLFRFLFIAWVIFELWIIITPVNLYTFRPWETLIANYDIFAGAFYPYQHLTMIEPGGDLGVRTEYAIPKSVTFITDEYGYRFDNSIQPEQYAGVIVGDSMVAGVGITQEETIASVLSAELGGTIYPFAPRESIKNLLSDVRFGVDLPPLVVLALTERRLDDEVVCPENLALNPRQHYFMETNPLVVQARIIFDRSTRERNYLINFLQSRKREKTALAGDSGMLFSDLSLSPPALEKLPDVVSALSRCHTWFAEQGVQFVFLPIPDRENIYFDNIPDSRRPVGMTHAERSQFLRHLIDELQANGVMVVDTLTAFEAAHASGMNPYFLDDTHWNADGIRLAVDLLVEMLEESQ